MQKRQEVLRDLTMQELRELAISGKIPADLTADQVESILAAADFVPNRLSVVRSEGGRK